ncbi:pantothenate synthetase [Candidatus Ruthia magnifica str. Cm (Calyptogena magnifica)]|uniref:Pantothenate synthetase n=1 Tax=Ruthia magnifica subsp. Calyptogena magnifica TaxID=413404 RepID=PANC_RUTMC|nr:pantoate--beta-alanine ligase [Candidatus Ruthturnera calyptogenae]A1AW71.1 RecName: Full=Pantothenate synthetase; Short=PS; AltName: Full=Pantoate--beta-alanine ligase; AltName: Full=Pantoate-activating enzyme [Candidatus Ruthia magnifica str. Cm (Calyptogena magnifica)]ABL02178.1 pantothenate synthetase [Candidatus Ruthia magnifica str. Cm (Calyptogena magnifica)]
MQLCYQNTQITKLVNNWHTQGKTVAFVPTMGGLHQGHLSLIDIAKQKADKVIVSIFVNPAQFSKNEDLDSYPRTINADLTALKVNVDGVFIPNIKQIYPKGISKYIDVGKIGQILCGRTRPHFFNGVAQVVEILFGIVRPDVAVFGQKDYQQLLVIKQMVKNLSLNICIESGEIIREKSGLAMSTRNQYLSKNEAKIATNLHKTLSYFKHEILQNKKVYVLNELAKLDLKQHFKIDYLEVLDANNLKQITDNTHQIVILSAVFLGSVRLIDNIIFKKG